MDKFGVASTDLARRIVATESARLIGYMGFRATRPEASPVLQTLGAFSLVAPIIFLIATSWLPQWSWFFTIITIPASIKLIMMGARVRPFDKKWGGYILAGRAAAYFTGGSITIWPRKAARFNYARDASNPAMRAKNEFYQEMWNNNRVAEIQYDDPLLFLKFVVTMHKAATNLSAPAKYSPPPIYAKLEDLLEDALLQT